jgi:predicted transcriptional regulator
MTRSGTHITGDSTPATYFAELRQRLQRAGIFENRLAAAAGMTPTQFSRSMQGRTDPRLSTMARLERAFETLVTAARA